ncbi:hypothetical protein INQ71_25930, partial [Escherichia coli]|nr:hypothetical protein [Escherichia coli]
MHQSGEREEQEDGPMGAWLVHHNVLPHDGNVLRVKGHQGRALGRDGVIDVTVT